MSIFTELSLIVVVATIIASIMRMLKQPLIMGHILTGLVVGPQILNIIHSTETIEAFAKVGIAILLFIVGIGLSPKIIKEVGKVSVITGLGQIIFTTLFGFIIARVFGYETVTALYIAVALTFSSTIIILKLLSDKKDTQKLYGRISIGFLLVQDVVATIILILASSFRESEDLGNALLHTLAKGIIISCVLFLVSRYLLPKLSNFFAKSQEFLFLFSIGWGLGLAAIFQEFGFSIEIGALIAGVTLAVSPYSQEIESKLKPLRDFFVVMFFVLLGMQMNLASIAPQLLQALVFSIFVMIGNPLIVMILMGILGYNRKTGFMAGLTVAQISEFSLILILLGVQIGHVSTSIASLVTLVGLITIAGSSYLIIYSSKIYPHLAKYLGIFERKRPIVETDILGSYDIVLFGANRVGYDFIKLFKNLGQSFLVVDFDPEIIKELKKENLNCKYGDAEDGEFLDDINADQAKMIVSTIPDYETNMFLLSKVLHENKDTLVILVSYSIQDALELYKNGATYVILPHFIGGHFAAMLAEKHWLHIDNFNKEREKHIAYLHERHELGHHHPAFN